MQRSCWSRCSGNGITPQLIPRANWDVPVQRELEVDFDTRECRFCGSIVAVHDGVLVGAPEDLQVRKLAV